MGKSFQFMILLFAILILPHCNENTTTVETTIINSPPQKPYYPSPADSALNQRSSLILSWQCNDVDEDSLMFDVFVGKSVNQWMLFENIRASYYQLNSLEENTKYYWKIEAKDSEGNKTTGDIWTFITGGSPNIPSSPSPAHKAINTNLYTEINWSCDDPDGDSLFYDLYFSDISNPVNIESDILTSSFNLGKLDPGITYYWKIVAKDLNSSISTGEIWYFTTSDVPEAPREEYPLSGAVNQKLENKLLWYCSDPDGDSLVYDYYFGDTAEPIKIDSNLTLPEYQTDLLEEAVKYYWKVVAKDGKGNEKESETWFFKTGQSPLTPVNLHPINQSTGQSRTLELSWDCSDPDGDELLYDLYFGASENLELIETNLTESQYLINGLEPDKSYQWSITAKDINGNVTKGNASSFKTGIRPGIPNNLIPNNSAEVISPSLILNWECIDPNGVSLEYDVYVGSFSGLQLVGTNEKSNQFLVTDLEPGETYYWKVIARNSLGFENSSAITSFTTNELMFSEGWGDYLQNPLITPLGTEKDRFGVYTPVVLEDNGKYFMWFEGRDGTHSEHGYIYAATSSDGLTWNRVSDEPVISPSPFEWDSHRVRPGPVFKEDGIYKMYYTGYNDDRYAWKIGLAASYDGIIWTKHQGPVFGGTANSNYRVIATDIKIIDNKYFMYYFGQPATRASNESEWLVKVAVSVDGTTWTPYDSNPILDIEYNWEFNRTMYGNSIFENGIYKMVYLAGDREQEALGFAYSIDGLSWKKDKHSPFFNISMVNLPIQRAIMPCLIKTENEYRIYYAGLRQDDVYVICVIRKPI